MRTRFKIFSRLFYSLSLLGGVIVVGTLGYRVIEGYSFLDAFYMTLITVSTVGYGEVTPLSDIGKIFTAFLILICFGTFAYAVSSITSYLVNGEYRRYVREIKKFRMIDKLNNHIIVCGYGRVGKQVVAELKQNGHRFVVIESKAEIFTEEDVRDGVIPVYGDATDELILSEAGVERANAVITTLPNDADNLYVVLSARELNKSIKVITRASRIPSVKKMRSAGATNVIMPDTLGGSHMAQLVMQPDTVDFIDQLSITNLDSPSLVEIEVPKFRVNGMQLRRIKELAHGDVVVVGVKTEKGEMLITPDEDILVYAGEKLFVIAEQQSLENFKHNLNSTL